MPPAKTPWQFSPKLKVTYQRPSGRSLVGGESVGSGQWSVGEPVPLAEKILD
jgi:hypothetical protein